MLFPVLVLAAIQLVVAWGCYSAAHHRGAGGFVLATCGGLLGYFVSATVLMSPLLALQFLLLTLLGLRCLAWRVRGRTFLLSGIAGSLIAVLVAGAWSAQRWTALRADYPLESLADRLAYESRHSKQYNGHAAANDAASDDAAIQHDKPLSFERLTNLDESYDQWRDWTSHYQARSRTESLRLVHASHVQQFIDSEGFGVGRMMIVRPTPGAIDYVREPVPMPADNAPETSAEREQDRKEPPLTPLAGSLRSDVRTLLSQSLSDFANPAGYGYIESRQRVAGFLPHAFSELPALASRPQWAVRKVELVSLLKHERPMVYVSANLPNMSELRDAPVRPVDGFEQRSLAVLRAGEDLETESTAARIRMLGAIRAAKQCLECHSVEHGALLGAFSYELRPTSAPDEPAVEPAPAAAPL